MPHAALPHHSFGAPSLGSIHHSLHLSASAIWLSAPGTFSSAGRQFVPLAAREREGERVKEERALETETDR